MRRFPGAGSGEDGDFVNSLPSVRYDVSSGGDSCACEQPDIHLHMEKNMSHGDITAQKHLVQGGHARIQDASLRR